MSDKRDDLAYASRTPAHAAARHGRDYLPVALTYGNASQTGIEPILPAEDVFGAEAAGQNVPFVSAPVPFAAAPPNGMLAAGLQQQLPADEKPAAMHSAEGLHAGTSPAPVHTAHAPADNAGGHAAALQDASAQTAATPGEPAGPEARTLPAVTGQAQQASTALASGATSAQTEQIDFTGPAVPAIYGAQTIAYSLPSFLYQNAHFTAQESFGSASVSAAVNLFAGIKGSVALGLGDVTPNFPVSIDPGVLGTVIDNSVFTIDPSLISTNDASFSLNLPTAAASLDIGLQGSASLSIHFPQVPIGVSVPFYGYVGTTVSLPTLPVSLSVNAAFNPSQNTMLNIAGAGTLTLSEINQRSINSGTASAAGGLPTLTATGSTPAFLTGSIDLVKVLSYFLPESGLEFVDGSADFSVGSASWSLFSLPLSVSLGLGETVTVAPIGIMETVTDTLNGQSQSGTMGTSFTFTAPASGSGVIPIDISYTLKLEIETSLGLDGTISLALDGPHVSATVLGVGFNAGPFGQQTIFSESGQIAQIASSTSYDQLSGSSVVDVDYQATAVSHTITTPSGGVLLNNEGEKLTVAAGSTVSGTTYGIEAVTQCVPSITNNGTVSSLAYHASNPGTPTPTSYGIDLLGGGTVTNSVTGVITSSNYGTPSGHGFNWVDASVKLAANAINDVYNAGLITGFETGVSINGGVLVNAATGTISPRSFYQSYGISSGGDGAQITNSGVIEGSYGIRLSNGGSVTNTASGLIDGGARIGVAANGSLSLTNSGTIIGLSNGVAANNATVNNLAGGLIEGQFGPGIVLGGNTATLVNAGTISGDGAVYFDATVSNTLIIEQGAVFDGTVQAAYASASNAIYLAANSTGTLAGIGTEFAGFQTITIGEGATWQIAGSANYLGVTTIDGFTPVDTVDFSGLAFTGRGPGYVTGESVQVDAATGIVSIIEAQSLGSSGITLASVHLGGVLADEGFNVVSDGHGGTLLEQTGLMNATISTQGLGGIVLSAGSVYASTLTITAAGGAAGQGVYAGQTVNIDDGIMSEGEAVFITNAGSVAGYQDGIYLTDGGTITNLAGGVLQGSTGSGIEIVGGIGIVFNSGVIGGTGGAVLAAGGTLTNYAGGTITGRLIGVELGPQATGLADLVNEGLVQATSSGPAVELTGGGFVYNEASGDIHGGALTGTDIGVLAVNDFAKVANCGTISAGTGIDLKAGGFVVNESGTIKGGVVISGGAGYLSSCGSISGYNGVAFSDGGTIVNSAAGTIVSTGGFGISLGAASSPVSDDVKNSGLIEGDTYGVILSSASNTLFNAGTIVSVNGLDSVRMEGGTSNTLRLAAGFAFFGDVVAQSGAANSIELTASATAGVLSGLGSSLQGFSTITLDSGAIWTIETTATEAAGLTFSGQAAGDTIALTGGGTLGTNLSGFGTIDLDAPGTFTISNGHVPASQALVVGAGARLSGNGRVTARVTGSGQIQDAGSTLTLAGGFDLAGAIGGLGTIVLGSAGTFSAGASSSASHLLLEATASVSAGATFAVKSGETSLVSKSSTQIISLSGSGTVSVAKSTILAATGPGTEKITTALTNSGTIEAQSGTFMLTGTVSNSATLAALGGTLEIAREVTGTGALQIGASSTLWLQASDAASQTVSFLSTTGELELTKPLDFLCTIDDFGGGDLISLVNTTATSLSFANGVLDVDDKTTVVAKLGFAGTYTSSDFSLTMSGSTATIAFHG